MAKWLGAPLARGVSTATRAKDSDRQDACRILDDALRDGELSMEEHRERVSAATKAVTLGDLQRLVADLQVESAPAQMPALKSRAKRTELGLLAAAFVASVLLGVGIGWGVYGNTRSPLDFTSDPGARCLRNPPPWCLPTAQAAAFPRRAHRPAGADPQAVRRHHGLPAGDLPGVCVARSRRPGGRPPSPGVYLPRRLGRCDQFRQEHCRRVRG
ncbi:hypothetical protein J112_00260 [Mycobacterium tuberculosis str. Beijing/NITR203]|nr:hypothetical protein J112_00260 [Mycobacterium tuberculosis str. Beijing/NITR203]